MFKKIILILFLICRPVFAQNISLKVQSFNIYEAGKGAEINGKTVPKPFQETISVLKTINADIIGLQEVQRDSNDSTPTGKSVAHKIAKALGYYVFDQTPYYNAQVKRTKGHPGLWANAILSRYPIIETTPLGFGTVINVHGRKILIMNIHLDDKPYPPYQLRSSSTYYKEYPQIFTATEAIKYANIAHQNAMDDVMFEINQFSKKNIELVVITGDFNEPSYLDWTQKAVNIKRHPLVVEWPTTKRLADAQFIDTYRNVYTDEISKPGITWVPTSDLEDYFNYPDRIDFIFARAKKLKIEYAAIVGENSQTSEVVYANWPSDHRALIAIFNF